MFVTAAEQSNQATSPGGALMNKAGLTSRVARDTRITKVQSARVIDSLLDHISRALKKGERASLVGFGTFTVGRRRARTGRNPQTGAPITIPARRVVKFTSGKVLRSEVR
jgi:DNA-binding protein HU-beta